MVTFSFSLLCSITSWTAEVDQFTRRNEPLSDSVEVINQKANEYLATAIDDLNRDSKGCQEEKLYPELKKYFANHTKGKLVVFALNDNSVEKRRIPKNESIYADWNFLTGWVLATQLNFLDNLALMPSIRIGETQIGVDKLEHFFGTGFKYFSSHYLKGKTYEETLYNGAKIELIVLGGNRFQTGVFSYGDLSAEFNGMRFWNHMLQLRDDILGSEQNLGPYIVCQDKKWIKVKDLDFRNYIDNSMDEAINCSTFPTERSILKYHARLEKLTRNSREGTNFTCPIDPQALIDLQNKYGNYSKWIINKDGPRKTDFSKDFSLE